MLLITSPFRFGSEKINEVNSANDTPSMQVMVRYVMLQVFLGTLEVLSRRVGRDQGRPGSEKLLTSNTRSKIAGSCSRAGTMQYNHTCWT